MRRPPRPLVALSLLLAAASYRCESATLPRPDSGAGPDAGLSTLDDSGLARRDDAQAADAAAVRADASPNDASASDGGPAGLSCAPTGCGGDLTGAWTLSTICIAASGIVLGRPCATPLELQWGAEGTFDFGDAMQFTGSPVTYTAMGGLTFPATCLGAVRSCAELVDTPVIRLATPIGQVIALSAVRCDGDVATGCECKVLTTIPTTRSASTYTTRSPDILDLGAGDFHYCVRGDVLEIAIGDALMITAHR